MKLFELEFGSQSIEFFDCTELFMGVDGEPVPLITPAALYAAAPCVA